MKFKILFIALLVSGLSWGQVTIASDGLNNATSLFTLSNGDYYTGNSATGDRPATSPFASEGTDSRGVSNTTATLTSSNINTVGYTAISTTFRLASFSINSTGNGADAGDIVTVEISPNGGTNYYSTVRVLGNTNAYWAYATGTGIATTAYDGNATPVNYAPIAGGNRTTDGYSTVTITGLPAVTNLRVRITMLNNDTNERWLIDDFIVEGTSSVPCTTPTTQASGIDNANTTVQGTELSWTPGATATGSLVVIRPTASPNALPVSGTNYTPNTAWGSAAQIDINNRVFYRGIGSSVTGITGLLPETPYTVTIYAYNGSGTNICYNNTTPESITFVTLGPEPTAHAASFTCTTFSTTQINLTFSAANTIGGDGYLILYRIGAAPTGVPVDGANYAPGTLFGNATVLGITSNNGLTTSYNAIGLNSGTQYYFSLVPYSSYFSDPSTLNYRTAATIPITNCTTIGGPEINVRGVIGSNPTIADGDITPQGTDNTLFATVVVGNNQPKNFRIENTGTTALNVSAITKVGVNPLEFVVSGITFPASIPPAGFIDFTVTFSPAGAGVRSTTLTIANTDSNENPYNFVIQGTGTLVALVDINVKGNGQSIPDNSIYPQGTNHTAFGVATVGVTTVTRTFTIENLGSTALDLTGTPYVTIIGPHAAMFTVSVQPSTGTIAGGSFLTFDITFNPNSPGAKNATVIIANSDVGEDPYNFNISGNAKGVNNIYVYGNGNDVVKGSVTTTTTNLTDFSSVAVPSGVKQNTFIISNLSGITTYFSNVTISGLDAGMFTVIAQPTNNGLGSGNSTSFTINFTPSSTGTKTATVSFNVYTDGAKTTPEPTDPIYTFAISGDGIVFTPCTNNAVQTLAIQDFEFPAATPTYAYTYTTDGTVNIAGGTYNNGSGSRNAYIDARSFQMAGIGTSSSGNAVESTVITMAPIDVSQYNNINLSLKVAAFRTASQGLDINEFIQVETSIDGGTNWSTEAVLRGYSNSRWDFAASGVFNAYYTGTNNGATVDTRNGNADLANGLATFYVNNLPQSPSLLIRFTLAVDRSDEIWAIDNIKIEGQTPQSTTWLGTAWSDGFPTSSTKAIINTGTTYTTVTDIAHGIGSIDACELEIRSGATVTVDSNYYFEIQSNIKNDGILNINNNGSLVQVNDTAINTGDITYSRISSPYERFDYTYWSSPVDTTTPISTLFSGWRTDYAFEFKTANFYDVKTINSAGVVTSLTADSFDDIAPFAWERYTGAMTKGKGYAIMGPTSVAFTPSAPGATVNFKGIPNNGVITLPLVLTANIDAGYVGTNNANDDYNLVGNPYPSALYADKFIIDNGTNTSGTLYFWTHVLNITASNPGPSLLNFISDDYALYNRSGGTRASLTTPASSIPTGFIGSGQAFFVEAQSTNDLKFNNSMRSKTYANTEFFRTSSNAFEKDRVWLNLQNSDGMFGQLLIAYFDETTLDFDWAYDGRVNLSNNYVSFYSISGDEKYKIQARPTFDTADIVPLGYFSAVTGEFTISIDTKEGALNSESTPIYLEDKFLNVTHNLKQSPYTFQTAIGRFENRFLLRYTEALGSTTLENLENSVVASTNHGQLTINSYIETIQEVTVYDILGRQLLNTNNIGDNTFVASNISMSQQALIVKIELANGLLVTRKIIL